MLHAKLQSLYTRLSNLIILTMNDNKYSLSANADRPRDAASCPVSSYSVHAAYKISNSKSYLKAHFMSSLGVLFHRRHIDFLLDLHCNYVSIVHCFRDIIAFFPKFKEVT